MSVMPRTLTPEEAVSVIEELRERVDTLEQTVDIQQRQLRALRTLFDPDGPSVFEAALADRGLKTILDWLEITVDPPALAEAEAEEREAEQRAVQREIQALHRERMRLARRLVAVEDEMEVDAEESLARSDAEHSPLTLLERLGPEAVSDRPSATLERARVLLENRARWGETRHNVRYGRHHILATRQHDLRDRLEDARGESLGWIQVHRAMEKIADLSGGSVRIDPKYGDWGKALVWTHPEADPMLNGGGD